LKTKVLAAVVAAALVAPTAAEARFLWPWEVHHRVPKGKKVPHSKKKLPPRIHKDRWKPDCVSLNSALASLDEENRKRVLDSLTEDQLRVVEECQRRLRK
jgi:hypothetical protein